MTKNTKLSEEGHAFLQANAIYSLCSCDILPLRSHAI